MDRKELDEKLAKQGYEHPENDQKQSFSAYKVYSETSQDIYVSQNYDPYAKYNDIEQNIEKPDICPICQKKAMYSCSCDVGELMCENAHAWYILTNGQVVVGDPHEKDD